MMTPTTMTTTAAQMSVDWLLSPAAVADHLEELRDYFQPEQEAYLSESGEFLRQMGRLRARQRRAGAGTVSLEFEGVDHDKLRHLRQDVRDACDASCERADRQYSHRVWSGNRTVGYVHHGPHLNLRKEDRSAWNTWYQRLLRTQMRRAQHSHDEILEAVDPLDGHEVRYEAADIEPPILEGTGNQLSGVEQRLLKRLAQASGSGWQDSEGLDDVLCRPIQDVSRFDLGWRWGYEDPTGDAAAVNVELEPFIRTDVNAALRLPRRSHNRNVRWNTLDMLLDVYSSCAGPDLMNRIAIEVFTADATYRAHVDRLVEAKRHRGRRRPATTAIRPRVHEARRMPLSMARWIERWRAAHAEVQAQGGDELMRYLQWQAFGRRDGFLRRARRYALLGQMRPARQQRERGRRLAPNLSPVLAPFRASAQRIARQDLLTFSTP